MRTARILLGLGLIAAVFWAEPIKLVPVKKAPEKKGAGKAGAAAKPAAPAKAAVAEKPAVKTQVAVAPKPAPAPAAKPAVAAKPATEPQVAVAPKPAPKPAPAAKPASPAKAVAAVAPKPAAPAIVPVAFTAQSAAEGWIQLFDGESLFGWTEEDGAAWRVLDGQLSSAGQRGWLRTNVPFSDFRMRFEIQANTSGAQGALLLRAGRQGDPRRSGMPVEFGAGKDFELQVGTWHVCDILARGSDYVVKIDGKDVLRKREFRQSSGYFGVLAASGQVAVRKVLLRPLDMACLFNGKDLTGWRRVERMPAAAQPAQWNVNDGAIHVEHGPGQLETVHAFDDFVLQADVRANSSDPRRHPNSGIFLRGDREFFWSGYESQIRNEYEGSDPRKPVDFGTGGIYRNQAARRIVANDNEWFTKTIIASGRHLAVWVNGVPVTNWEDPNPEGLDVRARHARLLRGTISLQAHDPTTNLDFRNICIAPLPRMGGR